MTLTSLPRPARRRRVNPPGVGGRCHPERKRGIWASRATVASSRATNKSRVWLASLLHCTSVPQCATICITQIMEENAKNVPLPTGRWLALIVAAVVLAEGIWAILVSITRSLILPLLARIVGGDPQSGLYLGKGDVNIPDLFGSVLQICLAAIVFLIIRSWPLKSSRGQTPRVVKTTKPVPSLSVAPEPKPPKPSTAQAAAASAVPAAQPQEPAAPPEKAQPAVLPKSAASPEPAKASLQPQPASKPAKPKKPQEVYYNIVGEPMSPEDE